MRYRRHRFHPWFGKISWSRKQQATSVFLPGEFHGQEESGQLQSMWSQRVEHDRQFRKLAHAVVLLLFVSTEIKIDLNYVSPSVIFCKNWISTWPSSVLHSALHPRYFFKLLSSLLPRVSLKEAGLGEKRSFQNIKDNVRVFLGNNCCWSLLSIYSIPVSILQIFGKNS